LTYCYRDGRIAGVSLDEAAPAPGVVARVNGGFMSKRLWGLVVSAAVVCLAAGTATAALTNDQAKCQDTAAKQGRVYLKKAFKARQKCEDSVNKGALPEGTDCALEATTAAKVSAAAGKYSAKVTDKCPDAVVATLSFGDDCRGVMAGSSLATCLLAAHDESLDALLNTAYPLSPAKRCDGGTNNGKACTVNADCSGGGTCVLPGRACTGGSNDGTVCDMNSDCMGGGLCLPSKDQANCAKTVGKTLIKQANKRLTLLQKCKKSVAKGDLPDGTDCVTESTAKLTTLMAKSAEKIQKKCTDAIAATDLFGGSCAGVDEGASVAACGLCAADSESDTLIAVAHGTVAVGGAASAAQVANLSECVGGPMSRCRVGDYILTNDKIRVVVQDIQRNYLGGIGQFGGQIIDGDLVRTGLDPDRDNFEEWAVSLNIESTAHYTALQIINDGSDGGPAVLRATGVDDLLDLLNPSSVIADFGFLLPTSADDKDIPVTVQTDYIIEPGTNYVRVETTVQNMDVATLNIFFGEFINGSGEVELFQPGYGFGEPLVSSPCASTASRCNQRNNLIAFSGENGADGVSYAFMHETPGSSTFTTSGVSVPQLGIDVLRALIGLVGPNHSLAPMGDPGDSKTFTRYFVVGDGSVSSLTDIRNAAQCLAVGTLQGTATADGNPAAGIDIAILGNVADAPGNVAPFHPVLARNVVTHTRTDASGNYSLTLPAGDYSVVANLEGSPYEGGGSSPTAHAVSITAFATTTQNVALPATGGLQVNVQDENAAAIAAKISVVGFDASPDPRNPQSILGLINNNTGVFGEKEEDGFPFGVALADYVDASGSSAVLPLEPGSYRVYVSHGPEYSVDFDDVTINAGATTVVNAVVEHVVDTTGFASGDFHVHSIDSPDAQVSRERRVISMLGEGVDFFATTDHGYRADFSSTITTMGVDDLVSTAVGQEITTFDYGHFNAWPLDIDPNVPDNGFVDHGGAAPDGMDYPSAGFYSETPATIVSLAHGDYSGGPNTVQINHVHSHFGVDGGSGLAIDTGAEPPTSGVPAAARRLNPGVTNYFTDTFDALEIWIGESRGQIVDNFLGQNAGDWFNLINQGIISTGISDSDTHRRFLTQAGFPRNLVANLEDDEPGSLDQDDMSERVNEGRVVGTLGPMIRVTAYAASTGESGGLDLGRCTGVVPCTDTMDCPPCRATADCGVGETCTVLPTTISTTDGDVDLTIDVQSPEWAEFDRIELYINTTTTRNTTNNVQTGAGLIDVNRYSLTPDMVFNAPGDFTVSSEAAPGTSSSRLVASLTVELTGLSDDTWVVVMVSGTDGVSKPLFPVVPNSIFSKACSNDPCRSCATNANCLGGGICNTVNSSLGDLIDGNLDQCGMLARAFTNPIFIDADGIGGWTAPGVQVAP